MPVLPIYCKTGKNVGRVLPLIQKVWARYDQILDDTELTHLFVTKLTEKPRYNKTRLLKIYKINQLRRARITIELKVNEPK